MAANDLLLQLIIKATDLASEDLGNVNEKVKELGERLKANEFQNSAEGMRAFGAAVESSTAPLATAAKTSLALSAAITGIASVMASQAYNSAVGYESAMAGLAKVLDGGMESAKGYSAELNKIALQYGQNGQQLVEAMTNFVEGGFSAADSISLVNENLKLMISGQLGAAESSDLLTSILLGFKAPAADAGKTVDILNKVSQEYATNTKELATGMAAISPIAKQMGFSMAETAGMLTPVIEVYRSGSEAADALKTGLQKLTDNTQPVKDALASLGVSQIDLNGNMRSGKDIFLDVAKSMVGLDSATKQYVIGQLVGIEQAGRMTQVFDNLSKYLAVTDTAMNSTGSAADEVAVRMETAAAKTARAEESYRQLSVTLGNTLKPQITDVISATGNLAAAFDRSIKAGDLSPLLNVIKPQIAAVENLFSAMANNLEAALAGVDWRPLVDGIKELSGEFGIAFAKLTEGMDLTTVQGLQALLQNLINLMGNFTQYVAGVVDGIQPFIGALNTMFQVISDNSPSLSKLAGQFSGLAESANALIPLITNVGGAIFGAVGAVVEWTFKIGLLVAALRLLNAAGIPVVSIIGSLVTQFLALNPAMAGVLAALAGMPGLVLGLATAAGGLGYALGNVINSTIEWASGGQSLGTMLYDLIHGGNEAEQSITRVATAEELAAAAAARTARELKAKQEAEDKARIASENSAKAQQAKIDLNASETETNNRLKAQYEAMGLVWDEVTGQITHQNELSAKQIRAQLELGTALDQVGVSAGAMSGRMTAAGQEMIATLNKISDNSEVTKTQLAAAFAAAIPKAETKAELDALRAKIEELGKNGKLTGEQVDAGLALIAKRAKQIAEDPAFSQIVALLASIREETDRETEALARNQEKTEARIKGAIELAKAKGGESAAAKLSAEATANEVKSAEERITQLGRQKEQIDQHIQRLYAQATADGNYSDEERKVIEALKDKSAALDVDIAKIEAHLPLQKEQAKQAEIMAGAIGELSRLYADQAKEHQRAGEASERYQNLQVQEAENALKLAQIKGDQQEIDKAQAALDNQKIEQAQALAATRQQEAIDAENAVSAKVMEMAADKEWTKADQEMEDQMRASAAAKRDSAKESKNAADQLVAETEAKKKAAKVDKDAAEAAKEHAAQSRSAGGLISKFYNSAISSLAALSQNAVAEFKRMRGEIVPTTNDLAALAQKTEKLDAAIRNVGVGTGLVGFLTRITSNANEVSKAFLGQAQSAEALTKQLESVGNGGNLAGGALESVIRQAKLGLTQFNLLDQQRLDNLRNSIDEANEKLREMQQEAQDAQDRIAELNAEIAAERGDTATADRMKLELEQRQALADIEQKIEQARMIGNQTLLAALEEQRRKLEELYALKSRNLEKDIQARQEQERTAKSQNSTTNSSSGSSSSGSSSGGSSGKSSTVTSGSSTGGGLSNKSNAFSLTVNTTGGIIDANFAEELARKLKPKLDEISRRSL